MPISRKQFELGTDSVIEEWMKKIHRFLADHKEEAFTKSELAEELDGFSEPYKSLRGEEPKGGARVFTPAVLYNSAFDYALEKLLEIVAVDARTVRSETYYRFENDLIL